MDIDQATQTMIDNLYKNTGKSLEQWVDIAQHEKLEKHGQIVKFLKENHGFTHGFANLVAHKALKSDAGSATNTSDLITKQYQGKEHLKPIYDSLLKTILSFGNDIEVAPKNAYVSLRRSKQFALLQPATKTRFEIGIILKGQPEQGILQAIKTANAMCTHKINITSLDEISTELIGWLQAAYNSA